MARTVYFIVCTALLLAAAEANANRKLKGDIFAIFNKNNTINATADNSTGFFDDIKDFLNGPFNNAGANFSLGGIGDLLVDGLVWGTNASLNLAENGLERKIEFVNGTATWMSNTLNKNNTPIADASIALSQTLLDLVNNAQGGLNNVTDEEDANVVDVVRAILPDIQEIGGVVRDAAGLATSWVYWLNPLNWFN